MNLRTFSAISAVSMLVLGGCVIVGTTPGGGNGGGGNGGDTVASSSSGDVGGQGGAGVGGSGGGGGAPACAKTCGDAITDGTGVCDTSPASLALYQALAACTCERLSSDADPGCKDECAASTCAGADPDATCGECLQKGGCMDELGACSSDI